MDGRAGVTCEGDGEVSVPLDALVLDDESECYRFTCPRCGSVQVKPADERIRSLLRRHGVPTIDELVSGWSTLLQDDAAIWREVLRA
jgi:hypothetical protein